MKCITDAIKGADVIALQEVMRGWPPEITDQSEESSKLLPDYYWVYGPSFDVDAQGSDHQPYWVLLGL